jgi:hypothetical protein
MRTRDLLRLENTGHPGINALFAKAHSADWDFERDVDWSVPIGPEERLIGDAWTAFGATETFSRFPERARAYATRRALGRMLNILQVGESVAQNVCATLVPHAPRGDYRNHAAAQAMDAGPPPPRVPALHREDGRRSRTSIAEPRRCSTRCSRCAIPST